MSKNIEIFFSYAHEDIALRNELENHISVLKRRYAMTTWHDRQIKAGAEWAKETETHLNAAHIILLLISLDFLASPSCNKEMVRALERHEQEDAYVIPIILRHVVWHRAPFDTLHPLPHNAIPVVSAQWHSRDEAFFDVVKGIEQVIREV